MWERGHHRHSALRPPTRAVPSNRVGHLGSTEKASPLRRSRSRPMRLLQQDHIAPPKGTSQFSVFGRRTLRVWRKQPAHVPCGETHTANGIPEPQGTHQCVNIPKFTQLPPIRPSLRGPPTEGPPQHRRRSEPGADPALQQAPMKGRARHPPAQGARAREGGRQARATQRLPKGSSWEAQASRRPSSAAVSPATRPTAVAVPPNKAACRSRGKGCTQAATPAATTSAQSLPYTPSTSDGSG